MILAAALLLQMLPDVPAMPPPILATQPWRPVLAAGTPVRLMTAGPIDSRNLRQGQRFALVVAADVVVDGKVVIAKGTAATGEVASITEKGMFGKGAAFTIQPAFIDLPGQRVTLTGEHVQQGKKQVAAAAATTLLITSFGMFITGKSATLPAGSELQAFVRTEAVLSPR